MQDIFLHRLVAEVLCYSMFSTCTCVAVSQQPPWCSASPFAKVQQVVPNLWGHGIPAMLAQQIGRLEIKSKSSPVEHFDEVPFGSKFLTWSLILFLLLHLSLICSHLISVLVVAVCGLYEGMHGVYQFLLNRISISKVTSRSWDSVAMSKTGRNSLKFSGTRGSGSLI